MTDNEIIKALECQANNGECVHQRYEPACGLWCACKSIWCSDMSGRSKKQECSEFTPVRSAMMAQATLDLINRLQAENKALIAGQETLQKYIVTAKVEAIKEFAERLKKNDGRRGVPIGTINLILKEMVGDTMSTRRKEDEGK